MLSSESLIQVHEGNVGIYYRYGALLDRVTEPGVKNICQNIFLLIKPKNNLKFKISLT